MIWWWLFTHLISFARNQTWYNVIVFSGIFDSWYWNQTRQLSMRIFTALSASVYKKSLKLSSAGRNKYTTGEVVNLIAVDCSKVQEATMFFNFIFTTPLQISLAIYFLWQYLNYSVLVGKYIFISKIFSIV